MKFRRPSKTMLGMLVVTLATSGCTLSRKKMNVGLHLPEKPYVVGETTRADVLEELGPPLKMSALSDGYVFMYEGLDTQELQLGFSLPIPYVNLFKFVSAQADYDHLVMVYQFDNNHTLVSAAGDDTHFDLGNSMAVQPVFTVQMLFDTSEVENDIISFTEWPAYCLLPLPQTLNRHNSVNTGETGVEQRGTSPSVGQRTLELHQK